MNKIILLEEIYHNEKWAEFLDGLSNQYDKDIAGLTMSWIKDTYPQFKKELDGKLIAEITRQE